MNSKILIADDHGIVRQGIRSLLERQNNFDVVGEVVDAIEILLIAEKSDPDFLVVDVTMSNFNGIQTMKQILGKFPDIKVIALSEQLDDEFVKTMFEAGICGYIFKDHLFDELIEVIEIIQQGGLYLSPGFVSSDIRRYVRNLGEQRRTLRT